LAFITPNPCSAEIDPFRFAVEGGGEDSNNGEGEKEKRTSSLVDEWLKDLADARGPVLGDDVEVEVTCEEVVSDEAIGEERREEGAYHLRYVRIR
jgi:hypothetical protein